MTDDFLLQYAEPLPDHLDEMLAQAIARRWSKSDGAQGDDPESLAFYIRPSRAHVAGHGSAQFTSGVMRDLLVHKEWAVEFDVVHEESGESRGVGLMTSTGQDAAQETVDWFNSDESGYRPPLAPGLVRRNARVVYSYRTAWRQP